MALNMDALMESADLSGRLRDAVRDVDRLGYEMAAVVADPSLRSMVPGVVKRMEVASGALAQLAQAFHSAVQRAVAGAPS